MGLARVRPPSLVLAALLLSVALAATATRLDPAAVGLDNRSGSVDPSATLGSSLPDTATAAALFVALLLVVGVVVATRTFRS